MPIDYERIQIIIPAHNEEKSISGVIDRLIELGLKNIRVIDNASTDQTTTYAEQLGAAIIHEPKIGYGNACLSGVNNLSENIEWLLFCDADGCDDLESLPDFFKISEKFDLILSNRRDFKKNKDAMSILQFYGNGLAVWLIFILWGHRYNDLGPMRLIRKNSFQKLKMKDQNYGWTVEMQIKAINCNLRSKEIATKYYERKEGESKISGSISGALKAGTKILWTIFILYFKKIIK